MTNTYAHPDYLVGAEWLAAHLDDPNLRILDATVFLKPGENGMTIESGRDHWAKSHIPGSTFIDLMTEASDPDSNLMFTAPSAERFAAAMGTHGVSDGTRVVIYDAAGTMWATRAWWLLQAFGHDNVAVLDGGWRKWRDEGRPTTDKVTTPSPATFTPRPRPEWFADKEAVKAAIEDGATCVVDALGADSYAAGHIPASVNVPMTSLTDPDTSAFLPADVLRDKFTASNAWDQERVITYCGGGIAATQAAFALKLLGKVNAAVYDGSMQEWAADESLTVETGA